MRVKKKKPKIASAGLARPEFRGDKRRLIQVVHGSTLVPNDKIPYCFSDPNLESGICNPNLPLREGEPGFCALAKSCLVAKALAVKIPVDSFKCGEKEYDEILAECDALFDIENAPQPNPAMESSDRQKLRGHAVSISVMAPSNPFRKRSLRRAVLDILSQNWISLADLKAAMLSLNTDAKRLDLTISQITSIASQEDNGYRIVEAFGKFKAFHRG